MKSNKYTFKDSEKVLIKLLEIGNKLSAEKDIQKLLGLILEESMIMTSCDAGSIYIVEHGKTEENLVFKYTKNESKQFPFNEFKMPINMNSIAGACAKTGDSYNFSQMSEVKEKLGFKHNTSFDESYGYRTMNMLVIPLTNYNEEVIGVIQLINKKSNSSFIFKNDNDYDIYTSAFIDEDEEIVRTMASFSGMIIERTILFNEIENLYESIIDTLVTALDQRDTITAGHSKRVAKYASRLAEDVNDYHEGPLSDIRFTEDNLKELYIAGMLHDVGKIGVREYVLMKKTRLSEDQITAIKYKYKYLKILLASKLDALSINEKLIHDNIERYLDVIISVNMGNFLTDENETIINKLKELSVDDAGEMIDMLTDDEYLNLSIKRGNLTDDERSQINSHAMHTYDILMNIDWTKDLSRVPAIASEHHEKLDGTGYPLAKSEKELSIRARILAIADIFDALTAKDRPYKPAMPVEKAISIIVEEADRNHLDKNLVEIFLSRKSYELEGVK